MAITKLELDFTESMENIISHWEVSSGAAVENKLPRQGHCSLGRCVVAAPPSPSWALQDPVTADGAGGRRGGLTQFSASQPFYSTVVNFVLHFAAQSLPESKGKSHGDLLRHLKERQCQYSLVLPPVSLESFWQLPSWRKAVTGQGQEEGKLPMSLVRSNVLIQAGKTRGRWSHFSSYHKHQQAKKWELHFPPVSSLLRNKEKSRVLI